MSLYEPVIGLEVHAQLLTRTKAFCSCSTAFGGLPNTQVCPTCLGLPGALPVLNGEAVRMAVRAALALGCRINPRSRFARKNYFYPDLPKGYQISQFDEPFSSGGHLDIEVARGPESEGRTEGDARTTKRIGITRVHMEEDAGKNVHAGGDSIVDLNRSGVPLVEIVGEPDLRSSADAAEYLRTLRDVLLFLGVNDGNLEEGSFRCDANVSIRKKGQTKLGTRVELKNINSFRFVQKAIDSEIERQEHLLETGGRIVQETRGWDEKHGRTFSLRSKETAQDYRYFPEPDLAPLVLGEVFVDQVKREMPELPKEKRARFVREMHLTPYAAGVLTAHPRVAAFFEEAATLHGDPVKVANFVQSELLRDVSTHGLLATIPLRAGQLAELLRLADAGRISGKQAKEVYAKVAHTDRAPADVVAELGIEQVTDAGTIEELVRRVVERNPKQAEQLRSGKVGLTGFFVGQVMKETKGSANPQAVNDALRKVLGLAS
jgi:aspartyl-tRNA(Asn)/glutamyl-tRNA(Gln) amidotransferase subunit B